MEQLTALVERHGAKTRPAGADSIAALEAKLGFALASDYKDFLASFGVIVHGSEETYGLGVPDDYYLNVGNMHAELRRDPTYPPHAVPVLDGGDGRYYLYDNAARNIILWATPNGGIVQKFAETLEAFLVRQIFRGG